MTYVCDLTTKGNPHYRYDRYWQTSNLYENKEEGCLYLVYVLTDEHSYGYQIWEYDYIQRIDQPIAWHKIPQYEVCAKNAQCDYGQDYCLEDCKEKCEYYSEPQSINPACNCCIRYNPVKMDMFEEHKYCVTCDHLISEIENDGTCKDCVEKSKYKHTEEQK